MLRRRAALAGAAAILVLLALRFAAAQARDGVVAVFTHEDLGITSGLPMAWVPPGIEVNTPDHWVLAKDEVNHVGDPVVLVIGDDRYAVIDAAEDVVVEYDPLPVVTDPEAAIAGGPLVHEQFGTNKVCDWSLGGGDLDGHLLPTVDAPLPPVLGVFFSQPALIKLGSGGELAGGHRRLQPRRVPHHLHQARVVQAVQRLHVWQSRFEHAFEFNWAARHQHL